MKVLIADDEPRYRDLLKLIFERWPEYQLTLAASGNEAWALLDDHKRWFDVVILDLNMPNGTGLDVLRRLQDSPLHRSLYRIICTARNDRDTVEKAITLGAHDYIIKPWTSSVILQKLSAISSGRCSLAPKDGESKITGPAAPRAPQPGSPENQPPVS